VPASREVPPTLQPAPEAVDIHYRSTQERIDLRSTVPVPTGVSLHVRFHGQSALGPMGGRPGQQDELLVLPCPLLSAPSMYQRHWSRRPVASRRYEVTAVRPDEQDAWILRSRQSVPVGYRRCTG
jgi:hypothetical protein